MNILTIDKTNLDKFGPYTTITGILLIVLGTVGIMLPAMMSVGTSIFISWLLITSGGVWGIHTYKYSPKNMADWFKPALLLITGGLMLFYPIPSIAAIGLLLAIYLLLDAYGSFALAQSIYPSKGWFWMAFNGAASTLLAMLFLVGWPVTSMWLVGLYVGISLLFDGWALLAIGWALRKSKYGRPS